MIKQFRWLFLFIVGLVACAGAQETASPTSLPPTVAPTVAPAQAALIGEPLHGYVNVAYTQADSDLVGKTKRAQLLNIYATW